MTTATRNLQEFKKDFGEKIKGIENLPGSDEFKKATKKALLKEMVTNPEYQRLKNEAISEKIKERETLRQEEEERKNTEKVKEAKREGFLQNLRQDKTIAPELLPVKEKQLQLLKEYRIREAFDLGKLMDLGGLENDVFVYLLDEEQGYDRYEQNYDDAFICYRTNVVADHIKEVKGLDKVAAMKLIQKNLKNYFVNNLDKFQGLDQDVASKLIGMGEGESVVKNLEKFVGMDRMKMANELIKDGQGGFLAENLEKFEGIDHKKLADKLIDNERSGFYHKSGGRKIDGKSVVFANPDKFKGIDFKRLALKLIKKGKASSVIFKLEKFNAGEFDKEVALELIKADKGEIVWKLMENLDKFQGLDQEIASKLIEEGYGKVVEENKDKFKS